jgi:hydrogenase maturation protease
VAAGTLVFAWGNPSRGDDALGPAFLDGVGTWLAERGAADAVELLTDFQLQPEHVIDLHARHLVLFVDASVACPAPFSFTRVRPRRDASFTSHAMSPGALLAAYEDVHGRSAPSCYVLAIRGHRFELGEDISTAALGNLEAALGFARTLLGEQTFEAWERMAGSPAAVPGGL